jgi:lipoprotein-anchoring transpeptidase ErfK/SrfK
LIEISPVRRHRIAAIVLAPGAVALGIVLVLFARPFTASSKSFATDPQSFALPNPVAPAFVPPKPRLLATSKWTSRYAAVGDEVVARTKPAIDAPAVARLTTRTPENTTNIVLVLGYAKDHAGRLWTHVRLAILPNNSTGWVPRQALSGYGIVRAHLVIDLELSKATLLRDGRPVFKARIGVGRPSWPTPKGEFYIRNKLRNLRDAVYGPLAFGTSARSSVLTEWPAGGFIGIHGTDQPELLPGRVSHGCIRMRNRDILKLGRLMPVGTPVTIR